MTDDSTHTFHNTNTIKNILTLSSVKTPSDPWGKELQGQQAGKEGLVLFLNPHQFPVSQPFWSFAAWGRNRVLGQPFIMKMMEDEEPSPPLLPYAEIWSPPAPVHPLLPPSPSPACTGLPQPHAVLGCAWPLAFGDKTTGVGTKTQRWGRQEEATWVGASQRQVKGEYGCKKNQNYIFRKERERIQEPKKNYTNCLEDTKTDVRPSPSPDLRERQREWLTSLGLKEKLPEKLSGAPHSTRTAGKHCPGRTALRAPHCPRATLPGPRNLDQFLF